MRALLVLLLFATSPVFAQPLRPVHGFEVERYLGDWHEIASIPASFQGDCVFDSRASYGLSGDLLTVRNSCRTAEGRIHDVEGLARFKYDRTIAALKVTFVTVLGVPVWATDGDYFVIALDPDYRWSAVADREREHAWILSRGPELDTATLVHIKGEFEAAGYDTCRILTSRQVRNDVRQPLCTVGDVSQDDINETG